MMKWQPIETAPKDGTAVLLSNKYGLAVASWETFHGPEGYWTIGCGCMNDEVKDPTHWTPLPDPPKEKP